MSVTDDDAAARQRRLLGWGLACPPIHAGADLGRDLVLQAGPTDATTVSGFDNLAQVLEIALTTGLGSDPFNVGFGFDGVNAMVDGTDVVLTRERVRVAIIQVLNADPRVRRIIDLKVLDRRLDAGGSVVADADLTMDERIEAWRTVNVFVAFEAISGEQLAVNLGGVMPRG
jgi:phage baseplate assembly protein W